MELLKQLFAIHSPSGKEYAIRKFIGKWIKRNVPGCNVKGDRFGNMYITKGESKAYPCAVAHLDQVQRPYPSDYQVIESNDAIFAYSRSRRRQCGLGADDKCGIWIALNLLARYDAVKVAFFSAEETGCKGSSNADMAFFGDTKFVIEADRRGSSDLITEIGYGPICSDEFVALVQPELFGYAPAHGLMTDVEALRDNGYPNCCINFSCGYYNPHTDEEFVDKGDLLNAFAFACHVFDVVAEPMPFDAYYSSYYYDDCYYSADYVYDMLDSFAEDYAKVSVEAIVEDVMMYFPDLDKGEVTGIVRDWKSFQD